MARIREVVSATLILCLAAGCRIEQTPDEYFDHAGSIANERLAAAAEVRDRLLAFGSAIGRGDPLEAIVALNPAARARVWGPIEILNVEGAAGLRFLVDRWASAPVAMRVQDVSVETGPTARVAWFNVIVEAPGRTAEPSHYRATGLYLRNSGVWELVQAHISGPITVDSTANRAESAGSPAEGG